MCIERDNKDMIGKLSGIIDSFSEGSFLLDINGVCYLVHASNQTLSRIGQVGDTASVLIDTHVREDAITLFGFASSQEQLWFRLLNSVQGVGAKAAFAILAVCPPDRLNMVIIAQDKAALTQADGVGPKLAARILTELKDKAAKLDVSSAGVISPDAVSSPDNAEAMQAQGIDNDAVSALVNLGYGKADAYAAVMRVKEEANDNLQVLIRLALKELSA